MLRLLVVLLLKKVEKNLIQILLLLVHLFVIDLDLLLVVQVLINYLV